MKKAIRVNRVRRVKRVKRVVRRSIADIVSHELAR